MDENTKIIIDQSIHNNSNINQKKKKIRNPSVDLIRIIGMYFIILNHLLFIGNAFNKYPKYKIKLLILHILSDWHNNGFILISGIVGYKVNRYSNLLYLWLTVFFYSFGINLYFQKFQKYVENESSIDFFPIIFQRYWYFTAYFGMYLFLPVINKGISYLTRQDFKLVIMSTFGIFDFWRDLKNQKQDIFNMRSGNSMIWFLTYYLTGAYIGKYKVNYSGINKYIFFFICIFIYFFSSYLYIKVNINNIELGKGYFQK